MKWTRLTLFHLNKLRLEVLMFPGFKNYGLAIIRRGKPQSACDHHEIIGPLGGQLHCVRCGARDPHDEEIPTQYVLRKCGICTDDKSCNSNRCPDENQSLNTVFLSREELLKKYPLDNE